MSKRPGEGQVFLFARQRVLTLAILGTRRQYRRELELKMDLEKAEVESKVHPTWPWHSTNFIPAKSLVLSACQKRILVAFLHEILGAFALILDANFLHRFLKAHISWWHSEAAEQARCCKRNSRPPHAWTWSGESFWLSPSSWIVVIPSKSSFLDWDPRGDLIRSEAIPDFHSVGKISKAVGKNAFLSGTFALHSSKYLHTVMKLARSAQYAAKVFPYITAYLR